MLYSKFHFSASREEAFGLVNVEALSVGTPIMANKVGGITDIVEDGSNGYFFDPDRNGDFVLKAKRIIDGDWDNYSKNARESYIKNHFASKKNLHHHAKKLISILN